MKRWISVLSALCMMLSMLSCFLLPASAAEDMAAVLPQLSTLTSYFASHPAEKTEALNGLLADANQIIANPEAYEPSAAQNCLDALKIFRRTAPYLPRVTEVDQYPGESGYMIYDTNDLLRFSNSTSAANIAKFNRSQTLYLANDIDMSGITFWPIPQAKFSFDGMGHTISNWTGKSTYDYQAFFQSYEGNAIKNVTFKDLDLESGYSRAVLISELKSPESLLIENVNMENITLNAVDGSYASGDRMGLYISRNTSSSPTCAVTIKNCMIKNCKMTNGAGNLVRNINDSGLLVGHFKGESSLMAENILVINSSSELETGSGGLLAGNLENSGGVIFKNIGVIGGSITNSSAATSVGIMIGMHSASNTPHFENCFFHGITSDAAQIWARGNNGVDTVGISLTNCFAEIINPYMTINFNGSTLNGQVGSLSLGGIDSLEEAVWAINDGVEEPIFYLNQAATAIALSRAEGYYLPHRVSFTSNTTPIGNFYTNGDGKLPHDAKKVVEDILYSWSASGAPITMDTVFTADTDVISTVVHSFEDGTMESNEDGTHKVYCTEDNCNVYKTENCSHKEYLQNGDLTHSSSCTCGYLLSTEPCQIQYTFDGIDSHSGLCTPCGRTTEKQQCTMSDFIFLPGDEPTTEKSGKKTSTCDQCDHKIEENVNQLAAAKLVLEGEDRAAIGDSYALNVVLKENEAPGISSMIICITYDSEIFRFDKADIPQSTAFYDHIDATTPGLIKIGLIASSPVTASGILALLDFTVIAEPDAIGTANFEVALHEVTLAGTATNDPSITPLDMVAEGKSVVIYNTILGDANMDGEITMADAVLIMRVVNGKLSDRLIDTTAADVVAGDGLTTADVVRVLRYIMGSIQSL